MPADSPSHSLAQRDRTRALEHRRADLLALLLLPDRRDLRLLRSSFAGTERQLTTHGDAIERSYAKKLRQRIAKPRCQFQDDEKSKIDDHGPLASVSIRQRPKYQSANGSQHQSDRKTLPYISMLAQDIATRVCSPMRHRSSARQSPWRFP